MKTFLVVDDTAVVRSLARRHLENLGFAVTEAVDGGLALAFCLATMPDAILLDWQMPQMDGFDFLKAVRQVPGGSAPKILFCTTLCHPRDIARALEAGADEYVMKPFDRGILASKLEQVGLLIQDQHHHDD